MVYAAVSHFVVLLVQKHYNEQVHMLRYLWGKFFMLGSQTTEITKIFRHEYYLLFGMELTYLMIFKMY